MGGSIWQMSGWELIKSGGPIMIPIFLCSIFSLAIISEKLYYFCKIRIDVWDFKEKVFDLIKENKIKDAIDLCDEVQSPIGKVLRAGLLKFGESRETIKEYIEDASLFEIPKLEKRLGALATIAHITPLLGLLGTVAGMTASFYTIQAKAASLAPVTPGDLAGNIGEALLTTVAGLMVAIPTFVAYNYCIHRINQIVLDMERLATELVNYVCQIIQNRGDVA